MVALNNTNHSVPICIHQSADGQRNHDYPPPGGKEALIRIVVQLPGMDIRFPGHSTEQLKFYLEKFGLSFRGFPDLDGFQTVYLPTGWTILGRNPSNRSCSVLDEHSEVRLRVHFEVGSSKARYYMTVQKL